jgi:hypothetical protein
MELYAFVLSSYLALQSLLQVKQLYVDQSGVVLLQSTVHFLQIVH